MATLTITDRSGATRMVEGIDGLSVMENLREAGFDELLALCGGTCSCATCHVYVEGEVDPGPPAGDEGDLLDSSEHRRDWSRLSCQIAFTGALDGLRVHRAGGLTNVAANGRGR